MVIILTVNFNKITMKLRRRPLSAYNGSPSSNSQYSLSDQPLRKRQRKASTPPVSDTDENDSDIENRSSRYTSDGKIFLVIRFEIKIFLFFSIR